MNKNILTIFFLFFLLCYNSYAKTVIVSTGDYEPFGGKSLYKNGFKLDVIREAFKRSGYTTQYEFYSWARAYENLLQGKVDASAYYFKSKKRQKDCYYSEPIFTEKTVFYYNIKKPLKNWKELEDLKKYKIGATLGYTYTDRFWELNKLKILNISTASRDDLNLKKLINGRIDLFPSSVVITNYLLEKKISSKDSMKIKYNEKPLLLSTTHVLYLKKKKKSKVLFDAFNNGLQKIREDGTYDKMLLDLKNGRYSK